MPCLRGIEVSLTTKPDDELIPEYPHPEGTSARILGVLSNCTNGQTSQRKTGPTVAVYVPSIPGTPFAINYSINTAPTAPCKYIFFRLYMNGRPIAAWGIDSEVLTAGKVARSLWAPCALHNDQIGFEGRNFVFLSGQERKSVAEDGGLIEIQAFRARERRARAPRLEEFRFQENYGIAAPSIGLLDQPQDACFYDWHLIDAKDSPFASFRLHYRSWKNLKQLNLIPASELELLCSVSPKALKTIVKAESVSEIMDDESEKQPSPPENSDSDEFVFHDSKKKRQVKGVPNESTAHYFLKSPPERFCAAPSSLGMPQPSKLQRDACSEPHRQRPLPELPVAESSRLSRRLSAASARSSTWSITPSLLQYADEGSFNADEVELGVAQLVHLPQSEDGELNLADSSSSDYETSPRSAGDTSVGDKLSPGRYLPMTGSGLERGIAFFTPPKPSLLSTASNFRQSLPSDFSLTRDLERLERPASNQLDLTSPLLGRVRAAAQDGVSPQKDRGGGRGLFAGLRKTSIKASPRKLANLVFGRDVHKMGAGDNPVLRKMGPSN